MIALDTNIPSTRTARMHRFELLSADRDFSRFPGFDVRKFARLLVWRSDLNIGPFPAFHSAPAIGYCLRVPGGHTKSQNHAYQLYVFIG
jgi:hypothetical protein